MSGLEGDTKRGEVVQDVYPGEKHAESPNPLLDEITAMSPEEYAAFEKKLMRKIDKRIIPWMT